jgi:hypothetical protein
MRDFVVTVTHITDDTGDSLPIFYQLGIETSTHGQSHTRVYMLADGTSILSDTSGLANNLKTPVLANKVLGLS